VAIATPTVTSGETITEALTSAYRENPALLAQRMSLRRAQEKRSEALAAWRPTLALYAEEGQHRLKGETITAAAGVPIPQLALPNRQLIDESGEQRDVALTLTQPLYRGGRTVAGIDAAEAAAASERARTKSLEQTTLQSAATNFFDVLRDMALTGLREQDERHAQDELRGVNERLRLGQLVRTDVAQSEARLARAIGDRQLAEANLRASSSRYEEVVGHSPGVLQWPESSVATVPSSLAEAERTLDRDNPDIVAALNDVFVADYAISQVQGELLPSIDLVLRADRRYNVPLDLQAPTNRNRLDDLSATIRVTMNLYEPGDTHSRVRQARQAYAEASLKLASARRTALSTLRADWFSAEATRSRVVELNKEIEANRVAVQGAQAQLAGGTKSLHELLAAERDLIDAKVSFEDARHDSEVQAFNIVAAIGHLTAHDLGIDVAVFDAADGD